MININKIIISVQSAICKFHGFLDIIPWNHCKLCGGYIMVVNGFTTCVIENSIVHWVYLDILNTD